MTKHVLRTRLRPHICEVAKPLVHFGDGKVIDVELAAQQQTCSRKPSQTHDVLASHVTVVRILRAEKRAHNGPRETHLDTAMSG